MAFDEPASFQNVSTLEVDGAAPVSRTRSRGWTDGMLLAKAAVELIQDGFEATSASFKSIETPLFSDLENQPSAEPSPISLEIPEEPIDACLAKVSVLTLNVWVNKAFQNVHRQTAAIRAYDPDVICLQEVFSMQVLETYRRAFPDYKMVAFGRRLTMLAFVAGMAALLFPPAIYAAAVCTLIHLLWGPPGVHLVLSMWLLCLAVHAIIFKNHYMVPFLIGNLTGLALLVRQDEERFSELTPRCMPFSTPEGHAEDFLNWFRPRGCLFIAGKLKLPDRPEPFPFCVGTTHLNQPPAQPAGRGRHQQVTEMCAAFLEQCGASGGSLMLLGADLNATPPGTKKGTSCNTYKDVLGKFSDAWADCHGADGTEGLTWDQQENPMCRTAVNSFFYGTELLRWRCDYIFWKYDRVPAMPHLDVSVKSCDLVFCGEAAVSDHFGVFAVAEICSKGAP